VGLCRRQGHAQRTRGRGRRGPRDARYARRPDLGGGGAGAGRGFVNNTGPAAPSPHYKFKEKDEKDKAEPQGPKSYMPYYEEMLSDEKRTEALLTDGREFTKQQELDFWRWLLQNATVTSHDKVTILKKMADLEVDVARQGAKQRLQIAEQTAQHDARMALASVDITRSSAEMELQLGLIDQAQMLQLDMAFEERRNAIRRAALEARKALIDPTLDPVGYNQILLQIEELQRQHEVKMGRCATRPPSRTPATSRARWATSRAVGVRCCSSWPKAPSRSAGSSRASCPRWPTLWFRRWPTWRPSGWSSRPRC